MDKESQAAVRSRIENLKIAAGDLDNGRPSNTIITGGMRAAASFLSEMLAEQETWQTYTATRQALLERARDEKVELQRENARLMKAYNAVSDANAHERLEAALYRKARDKALEEVATLREALRAKDSELAGTVANLHTHIESLLKEVAARNTVIERQQMNLAQLREQISNRDKEAVELRLVPAAERYTALESRLDAMRLANTLARQHIESLKEEIATLKQHGPNTMRENPDLESRFNAVAQSYARACEHIETLNSGIAALRKELNVEKASLKLAIEKLAAIRDLL